MEIILQMGNYFCTSQLTIKSVNIYHLPQAWKRDGSFGRQEATLPCCIFAFSHREWAEPLKQNIFRRCVLRTSCLQMTCRYTHKTPYLAHQLPSEYCWGRPEWFFTSTMSLLASCAVSFPVCFSPAFCFSSQTQMSWKHASISNIWVRIVLKTLISENDLSAADPMWWTKSQPP